MLKVPFYERERAMEPMAIWAISTGIGCALPVSVWRLCEAGYVGCRRMRANPLAPARQPVAYDLNSFYLQVKKLGAGRTSPWAGTACTKVLGLILNNDFSFGKLSVLSSLGSTTNRIQVHSSRSSVNYLQGAAATYTLLKGLDLTAFFSYRKIDATLSDQVGIRTILKTGLHRTVKEIAKQNIASNTLMGGNINYRNQGWHIGATGFYTSFSPSAYARPVAAV